MRPFILISIFSVIIIIIAALVYITAPSKHQYSSPQASNEQKTPLPVPSGWKQFSDAAMNISFDYPQAFQITRLTQITPQLVSLSDPTHTGTDEALLIYSTTTTSDANDFDVSVPFPLPSQLAQPPRKVQLPG